MKRLAEEMASVLVQWGADLGDEREAVMTLLAAGYRGRIIAEMLDRALYRARVLSAGAFELELT